MPTCPTCYSQYPDGVSRCSADDVALVPDSTFAHVDRDIAPGTTVGEYMIEGKLGEGGFGAVYSATHPLIGKRAAVKVLSREFSSNPQMVSRFIAEARAVNQIRHRNIIDIFSFGQLPDGRQYYIMELLEGVTFDAYLRKRKRLSLDDAMPIFRGVARALDAAHAKGILHRDLKPENVFLVTHDDGNIEPKLLDFGLVKLLDAAKAKDASGSGGDSHNTKTGTPMGTPYYMSPEQCRGLDVDARTDVYSFGALAFEVLTGEVPFQGTSTLDILFQHMNKPPPPASERAPGVSSALDGPLAQIMAKEPAQRPQTVTEAVDLLARAGGMAVDSQRMIALDSSTMSAAERAVAPTIMAHDPVKPEPAKVGTFIGSETSVAPPSAVPKRSSVPILAVLGVVAIGGIAAAVFFKRPDPPATPLVQSVSAPPPAVSSVTAPRASDVEVKLDGLPDEATVSANGAVLGSGPGSYRVKRGVTTKLLLEAKGYVTKEIDVAPDEPMQLAVGLEKSPATAPAPVTKPRPAPTKLHNDLESF